VKQNLVMNPVRRWGCVTVNTATSVAVLNGNVERARTPVRTVCPVGIRIIAEGLNMVNKMLGQFNNRFKHEKSVCRNCPRESE
jgi:hypothetical protein